MRNGLLILFLLTGALSAASQTQWNASKSAINFKIKNAGLTVDGSFSGLVADLKFDANQYGKSSIEASIDVNTINTGIGLRNNHLKKENYFNVPKYPKIILKSTLFSKEGDGTFKGHFKLTMKGITKDIIIPFSYIESGNTSIFKATFILNRKDYNVGGNSWTMSDDVAISILINAAK